MRVIWKKNRWNTIAGSYGTPTVLFQITPISRHLNIFMNGLDEVHALMLLQLLRIFWYFQVQKRLQNFEFKKIRYSDIQFFFIMSATAHKKKYQQIFLTSKKVDVNFSTRGESLSPCFCSTDPAVWLQLRRYYLRQYALYDHYPRYLQRLPQKTSLNHTTYDLYDY